MYTIGVILAGGQSVRFGEDKSLYHLNGKEMYQHVADRLRSLLVCDDIVVSTSERLNGKFRVKTVTDEYEDCGPIGGLYSVSKAFPSTRLIVIACDTPYVSAGWIQLLLETADAQKDHIIISAAGGKLHPMVGIYQGPGLLDTLKKQIENRKLSMRAFFEQMNLTVVEAEDYNIDKHMFQNINYKSDID